ncbi:MAG: cobalamin-dependent protein [Chromatiales bacterium]|nr:cobalamin-dependent protein [Chromatiales bacterium]
MKAAMAVLEPELERKQDRAPGSGGKVVIGTVEGDIHDIGKNLVASMLQAGGFEVFDLGADVKLERFVEKAGGRGRADHLPVRPADDDDDQPETAHRAPPRQGPARTSTRSSSAARPQAASWADEIGADGYAENAVAAVKLVRTIAGRA